MTGDRMLSKRGVADARRVDVATISRYLTESRRRLRNGQPLRPMDIPIEDETRYARPMWRADGPIAAWIARTADRNPQTEREDTT
jgi:hypothetical protein